MHRQAIIANSIYAYLLYSPSPPDTIKLQSEKHVIKHIF